MLGSIWSSKQLDYAVLPTLLLDDSSDFTRKFFKCWNENRVHFLSKEDVVVLTTVGKRHDLRLELKKWFYKCGAEVVAKEVHIFLVFDIVAVVVGLAFDLRMSLRKSQLTSSIYNFTI